MVFLSRKAASIAGMLLVVVGWLIKAPMLAQWTNAGLISLISFLLIIAATISLLLGALYVQLGKRSRRPFILHIAFAALALLSLHFMFAVPLIMGIVYASAEIFWPTKIQTATTSETGSV